MGDPFLPPSGHTNTKATTEQKRTLLNKLRSHLGKSNDDLLFLRQHKVVIQAINELYPDSENSRQTRIGALCAICKSLVEQGYDSYSKAEKAYCTANAKLREALTTASRSRKPSEKQTAAYVPWKSIVEAFNKLKASVGSTEWLKYQKLVVMGLYVLLPPVRVDYAPLVVVSKLSGNPTVNTLLLTKSKAKFIMPVYKTAKSHGVNVYDAPPQLAEILRKFQQLKQDAKVDTTTLLLNNYGKPMTKANLGVYLRQLMEETTGKKFGVQMLRHSYNSSHIDTSDDLNDIVGSAKIMGHTPLMALEYAKRFTEPE
jgi:hypothetical protein